MASTADDQPNTVRRWPQRLRWMSAFALLVAGAVAFLLSNTTPHLHSCSIVSDSSAVPSALQGAAEQGTLRLPVSVCQPMAAWSLLPFAVVAILLLLPDFQEIGFGSVSFKRFAARISDRLDLFSQEVSALSVATGITKDISRGTVLKGTIRNVELRVPTVQSILLGTLDPTAPDSNLRLYNAGRNWGIEWSKDFMPLESSASVASKEGIRKLLDDWSYYDATAGMGRLSFEYDAERDCRPKLSSAMASSFYRARGIDLRHLIGGYIAGSLDGVLAGTHRTFAATLSTTSVTADEYDLTSTAHSFPLPHSIRETLRPLGARIPEHARRI